jgi:predicted polyphosphate/ATP-dependent NAD kinase
MVNDELVNKAVEALSEYDGEILSETRILEVLTRKLCITLVDAVLTLNALIKRGNLTRFTPEYVKQMKSEEQKLYMRRYWKIKVVKDQRKIYLSENTKE